MQDETTLSPAEKAGFFSKKLTFHLGNFLIFSSFLLFLYIYYPIIMIYLFPTQPVSIPQQGISIYIPKIGAYAPIVTNVDPWKKEVYQDALQKGVAHAKGTSLPGEEGKIFLFAHSSEAPWRITRINTVFFRLGELEPGDVIKIYKDGQEISYFVKKLIEVWPTEVSYLKEVSDELVLQTCTPVGTDFKRLLVFAEKIN